MKIKKVEWRNFFSYGNRKQVLDFPDDHSLIQVTGGNGKGKSSISQIITFTLYGKVEGKKLKDIPNRINGNAWARIQLASQNDDIVIERGLEPNIFKLFVNGIEYDQAGKKSIQEYIAEDIIGIPYYVFNNTILLSINDFKSFIKMGAADKRAIIDRIFGFQVLNQMRDLLKEEIRKIRSEADTITGELNSTIRSLEASMEELESATQRIVEDSSNRIIELEQSLEKFKSLASIHSSKVKEFKDSEAALIAKINELNQAEYRIEVSLSEQKKKLNLFSQEKCPTCLSDLSGDFHQSIRYDLEERIRDLQDDLDGSTSSKISLSKNLEESEKFKNDLNEKGEKIKLKMQAILSEINSEKKKTEVPEISSLKSIIDGMEENKKAIESKKAKTIEKGLWLKTLDDILGEKGVKQLAIKSVLPTLNSQIQDLLMDMGLSYRVNFDSEFDAILTHMGMEISVSSLSTGEMKKVDFAVLVAIIRLLKIKYSGLNILFLDEIFSSVDPEGVQSILKILKSSSKDLGLNIFVINHAPMPHEIFDRYLDVKKDNNFSHIEFGN